MENASSRQELTQQESLLRRTQIWFTYQGLVQRIKDALGFGLKRSTELERVQRERDLYKGQAEALASEKDDLLSKAEDQTRQLRDKHNKRIESLQASHLGLIGDLKTEIEAAKRAAEEAEAMSKDKLDDLADKLATEAKENTILRDQLQKEEQAHHDRVKEVEAHSRVIEKQLAVVQNQFNELETLMKAKEAAHRAEINNKPNELPELQKRVNELQHELDLKVALLRSALQNLKASHSESEDAMVRSIIEAIEKGIPRATLATFEQPMDNSVRKTYGTLVKGLDAVYRRLVPESERPPKSKPTRGAEASNFEYEVVEYVFSSLKVALPQPPSGRGAGISFQLPLTASQADTVAGQLLPTKSLGATVPQVPDREPFELAEVVSLANYSRWKRELYENSIIDQSSIRLVDILPGSEDDEIAVHFDVHPLSKVATQYEGLSYVCGKPDPAQNIIVNGVEAPVGPNLFDALKSLRHRASTRRIWIDAICINQMSLNEKSKEVQKMGPIYGLAKTVNVYLGTPLPPGATDTDSTSIGTFLKFLNRDEEGRAVDRYAGKGLKTLESICKDCRTDVHDVCKGFIEVCRQPWWGRIWTMQEFYLAQEEPIFYWGREHASNASLKRDFSLLMNSLRDVFRHKSTNEHVAADLETTMVKSFGSFTFDLDRISIFISRRFRTDGFDTPRRLYRELAAEATNPRDFIYGLRSIFDPVFGRVFVPDYQISTELLFAVLAVFLVQFEGWGDVLWWYPTRYAARSDCPSWMPNFLKRNMPHELDVQPLDQNTMEKPEPKLVVLNHRLHADGYYLDRVYSHRHVDKRDGQKILEELWQFDHCMNHNHECHNYFSKDAAPEGSWLGAFIEMYRDYYTRLTHFNSAFRGQLLQSTMKQEDSDKLPQQVAECEPTWDILRWHALKIPTPGLRESLGHVVADISPGYLKDIFSPRMETIFRNAFADFFIGACIFDWGHLSVWLDRFPKATPWSAWNHKFWSQIQESLLGDTEKRAKAIAAGYSVYEAEIEPQVMRVSWCYSFYYTFLAYLILLDCDDHGSLERTIQKLRNAGSNLRQVYFSITITQVQRLAATMPSIATRLGYYNTVLDLFRGRILIWTWGGFRGITCPGVETCCDGKSIIAIVDGLSFPVVVRDYDEETGEGWIAGCAVIRGVDMLGRDSEKATLPTDYIKGEKRIFKLR